MCGGYFYLVLFIYGDHHEKKYALIHDTLYFLFRIIENQHHLFRLHDVNLQLNETITTLTWSPKVEGFLYQRYICSLVCLMLILYPQMKQESIGGKSTLPMSIFLILLSERISSKQRNIPSKVETRTYEETMSNGRRKPRPD